MQRRRQPGVKIRDHEQRQPRKTHHATCDSPDIRLLGARPVVLRSNSTSCRSRVACCCDAGCRTGAGCIIRRRAVPCRVSPLSTNKKNIQATCNGGARQTTYFKNWKNVTLVKFIPRLSEYWTALSRMSYCTDELRDRRMRGLSSIVYVEFRIILGINGKACGEDT